MTTHMQAEELRIKVMDAYISEVISEPNATLDGVVNKVDNKAREVWKDYPKDVNFLAFSRVEYAKRRFMEAGRKH